MGSNPSLGKSLPGPGAADSWSNDKTSKTQVSLLKGFTKVSADSFLSLRIAEINNSESRMETSMHEHEGTSRIQDVQTKMHSFFHSLVISSHSLFDFLSP